MKDALKDYKPTNQGLFLKISSSEPVTLRVLTLDPLVNMDKWGGTRYSFVVWNWNEGRAQVLSKGGGILKQLTNIHRDEDYDDLNKIDVKITATGEGLETRYTVMPLPKAREMTQEMVEEAKKIDLTKLIPNGIRLSQVNEGEEVPAEAPAGEPEPDEAPVTDEELDAIDEEDQKFIDSIPF